MSDDDLDRARRAAEMVGRLAVYRCLQDGVMGVGVSLVEGAWIMDDGGVGLLLGGGMMVVVGSHDWLGWADELT